MRKRREISSRHIHRSLISSSIEHTFDGKLLVQSPVRSACLEAQNKIAKNRCIYLKMLSQPQQTKDKIVSRNKKSL